jgi:alkylhydroperoxidase/carboxymuconolactone decarboxylase family protein YurZ
MGVTVEAFDETLRKLSLRDDAFVERILARDPGGRPGLDPREDALVSIGALVALDATIPSYVSAVQRALACGVRRSEIVDALVSVVPSVGVARAVSAAPKLGLALGVDVSADLERVGKP